MFLYRVRRQEAELFQRALKELKHSFDGLLFGTTEHVMDHALTYIHVTRGRLLEAGMHEVEEVDIRPRLELDGRTLNLDVRAKGPLGEALLESLQQLEDEEGMDLNDFTEEPS